MTDSVDDPFCPEADPYYMPEVDQHTAGRQPEVPCYCGAAEQHAEHVDMTRRRALIAAGMLLVAPANAVANTMVPCVQTRQRITPCRHKFCKHYRGRGDYHGR